MFKTVQGCLELFKDVTHCLKLFKVVQNCSKQDLIAFDLTHLIFELFNFSLINYMTCFDSTNDPIWHFTRFDFPWFAWFFNQLYLTHETQKDSKGFKTRKIQLLSPLQKSILTPNLCQWSKVKSCKNQDKEWEKT